jgi:succinylarginine dihydrolase
MSLELNFDGLVGPTHNYAGLSLGNLASTENRNAVSSPRAAAKQGLDKMRFLLKLGIRQAVIPPLARPNLAALRDIGYSGNTEEILRKANECSPHILAACYSASSMWTANAATMAPSSDTQDRKVHFTPANLISNFHRSIEASDTAELLKAIFPNPDHFTHHRPLPATPLFSDEGAANHIRFAPEYGRQGIHLFVYGRSLSSVEPNIRFPQRQTAAACEAIVRNHKLPPERVVYAQQHPDAIEAGAFHNDVIATGNLNLFLYHHSAFLDSTKVIDEMKSKYAAQFNGDLLAFEIDEFSLREAVSSYLFNSQIVTRPDGRMILVAPEESYRIPPVREVIYKLIADANCPLDEVHFLDLRESMRNGGGPACLRNRVVLSKDEIHLLPQKILLDDASIESLTTWVDRHYRDQLEPKDLIDPLLVTEVQSALDELTQILDLGSIYAFQKA